MRTLVLNAGYEPLAVVSFRRAIVLVLAGKATVVADGRTPEEKGWPLRFRPRAPRGPAWVVRGADVREPSWEAFLGDAA